MISIESASMVFRHCGRIRGVTETLPGALIPIITAVEA
jgi:hypothetical protein